MRQAAIITVLFALAVMMVPATATENFSYAVVEYGNYGIPLDYVPTIQQEDPVYVNDTVDISLVTGWPGPDGEYRLAYYGNWFAGTSPEDIDPQFILKLPGKARSGKVPTQYKYHLDPEVFGDREGWWYQFYSNTSKAMGTESGGNLRAFYVTSKTRSITYLNNTTGLYIAGNYTPFEVPIPPLMPEKQIADLLVARGDAPDLVVAGERVWVFGRLDGLFGLERNITIDDIWTLEPGSYTTVVQSGGKNTIYDVSLDGELLIPGLYGVEPVDISAAQKDAYVMREKFMGMVASTDDNLAEYRTEIQEPSITLERIDEVYDKGISVLDIRGYTNTANGTEITLMLDEGRSYKSYIPERTIKTMAVRTHPGNLSYYKVLLPIDYDTLSAADGLNHTITARTALGGVVYKDFWISVLPADSYRPNATLKYIEDRNPFVPTPTPEIKVVEKIVEKPVVNTVTIKVTPSPSEIRKEQENVIFDILAKLVVGVLALFVLYIIGRFIYRAHMRKRWVQK